MQAILRTIATNMRQSEEKMETVTLNARIIAAGTAVGKKEGEGPLGKCFDFCDPDDKFGMKTWESAESEMQRIALNTALAKSGLCEEEIGALFAGDLLNQCVGSAYGLLDFDIPYFGLYGACSTSVEGLLLASVMVTYNVYARCGVVSSSHYCAAERQYRTPIEYGGQRAPTAQWTVTGAGALIVAKHTEGAEGAAVIRRGLAGRALDCGINDANNMGAAMAPAALDTLVRFFRDTGERPEGYDLIVTGDLGFEGGSILCSLMEAEGYPIKDRYTDCGQLMYDRLAQDVHCGGSGCGCAATVLSAHFLPKLQEGEIGRMLFLATGAMMSPDSVKQGQNIPSIAHLIEIEHAKK